MALCGIDLGTTNSLISVFEESGPRLIPNVHGEVLTPSVVGVDEVGSIIIGKAAKERLLTHPSRTIASFKRFMGTTVAHALGTYTFRPEELSALILRALREDAETHLGVSVNEVIISVPAYFNDHQRKATLDAGKLAGLKVERLINEPTAAALAYGLAERQEGRFLIFDLGGGTFDVSLLDKYEGVMEIRATAGDTALGGDHFTSVLEDLILNLGKIERARLDGTDLARLKRGADALKFELSRAQLASVNLQLAAGTISGSISRTEFETAATPLLHRLRAPVERAINDAQLSPADLEAVIMVGGATRMPMVRSLVARLFGKLPMATVDPDTTVALGAAVQAGLKARAAALEDTVMTDVCPFTLGVKTAVRTQHSLDTRVSPIIDRNAVVPISRSSVFNTVSDNQQQVDVEIYQGENLRPEHNVKLGSLIVPVPPRPAEQEKIDVRFTYDINGALEVIATVLSTKVVHSRIFRNEIGMTDEEVERRFKSLSNIKLEPRDQAENKALIARAERIYAELRGENREMLFATLSQFIATISNQSTRDLGNARREFAEHLDRIERSPFSGA